MNPSSEWETAGVVAGVHRTALAQPPRATPSFNPRFTSTQWPQHFLPLTNPRTTGARQESLGCCGLPPAPRNLRLTKETSAFQETVHDS